MQTETYIDKSTWRAGPWMDEPDRCEWRYRGLALLIVRNGGGALCGYVGLPPGHPMHGVGYDNVRRADGEWPDVHGGLTYAAPCQENGKICHVPQPGEPDDVWWIGFDCAHHGDYTDMKYGPDTDWAKRWPVRDPDGNVWGSGTYHTVPMVQRYTEALADQMLAEVTS